MKETKQQLIDMLIAERKTAAALREENDVLKRDAEMSKCEDRMQCDQWGRMNNALTGEIRGLKWALLAFVSESDKAVV